MANFYCEYCGANSSSVSNLTSGNCSRHPAGIGAGKHKLYQGSEKKQYTCQYCGLVSSSISNLTGGNCYRHPKGNGKGRHLPAL